MPLLHSPNSFHHVRNGEKHYSKYATKSISGVEKRANRIYHYLACRRKEMIASMMLLALLEDVDAVYHIVSNDFRKPRKLWRKFYFSRSAMPHHSMMVNANVFARSMQSSMDTHSSVLCIPDPPGP